MVSELSGSRGGGGSPAKWPLKKDVSMWSSVRDASEHLKDQSKTIFSFGWAWKQGRLKLLSSGIKPPP